MAYAKTEWKAREGVNLNKFTKLQETATSVILQNTPDLITVAGTPFSVESMNHIEQGIFDAHDRLDAIDSRYGTIEVLDFEPTVYELATMRLLPLHGQVIYIPNYQRLCNRKYVGDNRNATADWWYKISDPNNRNSRDENGSYMVVGDYRGLFIRMAGQNSKYKAANDTPYDGGAAGAFIGDAIRYMTGSFSILGWNTGSPIVHSLNGIINEQQITIEHEAISFLGGVAATGGRRVTVNPSLVVPTSYENRSASIACYPCISY